MRSRKILLVNSSVLLVLCALSGGCSSPVSEFSAEVRTTAYAQTVFMTYEGDQTLTDVEVTLSVHGDSTGENEIKGKWESWQKDETKTFIFPANVSSLSAKRGFFLSGSAKRDGKKVRLEWIGTVGVSKKL